MRLCGLTIRNLSRVLRRRGCLCCFRLGVPAEHAG
jgi:hypothetical protein